jgi:hypothetical protein
MAEIRAIRLNPMRPAVLEPFAPMRSRFLPILSALVLASQVIGSGCNSHIATYPVSGTVSFEDGQPVPYGAIEFRNEQSGLSARAQLDKSGAFALGTFTADDGAPAGKYRAIVTQYFNAPSSTARVRMDEGHQAHDPDADVRVATEVADFSTSPLRAEVSPDSENHFDFVVGRYHAVRASQNQQTGQ